MTDRPAESLVTAADAAVAATANRIVLVEHGGVRYIAKRTADRPRRLSQALFVRWLVRRVTGQSLPLKTLLLSAAVNGVEHEAGRLRSLARAGVRVPRVVHQDRGYLLLEHCGPTVESLLGDWDRDTRAVELRAEAEALGAFHRAGHWHGAAQVKNLTRRDGHGWRIDFEEDFGERVPLPAAQALDLVLLLNSVSLGGPVDEAEARALMPVLLDAYLAAHPDPQLRQALVRALPWASALMRLASPFKGGSVRGRPRKGVARLEIVVDALAARLG